MSHLLLTGHCDQLAGLLNNRQESPLGLFARLGIMPGLNYLLKSTSTQVNHRDFEGCTPLHHAVSQNHPEIVNLLLSQGSIEVNAKDLLNGRTPLHHAARHGHTDCVKLLLKSPRIKID